MIEPPKKKRYVERLGWIDDNADWIDGYNTAAQECKNELVAVLEKIASLYHVQSGGPAAALAQSALDTMRAANEYQRLGIDPANHNPDGSDYHLMNAVDAEQAVGFRDGVEWARAHLTVADLIKDPVATLDAAAEVKLSAGAYALALDMRDKALAAAEGSIQLTTEWGLRKLKQSSPAWAIQYKGMDWLKVEEFLPEAECPEAGASTLDSEMAKFAAAITPTFPHGTLLVNSTIEECAKELEAAYAECDTLNLLHGAARLRALKEKP